MSRLSIWAKSRWSTAPRDYQSGKNFLLNFARRKRRLPYGLRRRLSARVEDKNYGPEELKSRGFNVSMQHTDFMIGCPEMSIKGITKDGRADDIMNAVRFVNDFV